MFHAPYALGIPPTRCLQTKESCSSRSLVPSCCYFLALFSSEEQKTIRSINFKALDPLVRRGYPKIPTHLPDVIASPELSHPTSLGKSLLRKPSRAYLRLAPVRPKPYKSQSEARLRAFPHRTQLVSLETACSPEVYSLLTILESSGYVQLWLIVSPRKFDRLTASELAIRVEVAVSLPEPLKIRLSASSPRRKR